MSDRDRLIELLKGAETKVAEALSRPLDLVEWLGIYADHLLSNGVIVPPCKVGDKVYRFNICVWVDHCGECDRLCVERTKDGSIRYPNCIDIRESVATLDNILCWVGYGHFGETVFLTREEAEQELKERKEKCIENADA